MSRKFFSSAAWSAFVKHCSEEHRQRYLDKFTFRWNNRSRLGIEDQERARIAAYGMDESA
jgi:hypothetical protein